VSFKVRPSGTRIEHLSTMNFVNALFVCLFSVILAQIFLADPRGLLRRVDSSAIPPEQFVQLSRGRVRYTLYEPKSPIGKSRVVVLVHGFSVSSYIYDPPRKALVEAGYRVLTYDNYGRGYTDSPDTPNDGPLFVSQLAELLFTLGLNDPIDLVGFSMGGAISILFADTYPEKVARLILISSAGLPVVIPFFSQIFNIPVLGAIVGRFFGSHFAIWIKRFL